MITIIVTSYDEPKATIKAVNSILKQEIPDDYKIVIAEPFEDVIWELEEEFQGNNKIEFYQDKGEGKSVTLNELFKKYWSENKNDLIILTDGDVYLNEGAIRAICDEFKDESIGIVCGQPVSINPKDNMLGYWSHLLFNEMNKTRKKMAKQKEFFEVSGYLFAMRNGVIKEFAAQASEDNVLPTLFWKQGYKVGYAEQAKVNVLNPTKYSDWVLQKKRNIKGHIALKKLNTEAQNRRNTFAGEAKRGLGVLGYSKNLKEFVWTLGVLFARLHIWIGAYYDVKIKKEEYKDGWRENITETTRPLD